MRKNAGTPLIPSAECAEKCGDSPVPAMNYAQKCGKKWMDQLRLGERLGRFVIIKRIDPPVQRIIGKNQYQNNKWQHIQKKTDGIPFFSAFSRFHRNPPVARIRGYTCGRTSCKSFYFLWFNIVISTGYVKCKFGSDDRFVLIV